MKHTRRVLTMLLALMLMVSVMAVTASANEEQPEYRLIFAWLRDFDGEIYASADYCDGLGMIPGDEFGLEFYVGTWNSENGQWEADINNPIPVEKLVVSEHLEIVSFADLGEGAPPIWDGDAECFCFLSAKEDTWDNTATISYTMEGGTTLTMEVGIQRGEAGFYSAPVLNNENYIRHFAIDPLADSNVFYFGFDSEYWNLQSVELDEWSLEYVTIEKTSDSNIYKITVKPEAAANAWLYNNFWLEANVTAVAKDNPEEVNSDWWFGIDCHATEMPDPDAVLMINEQMAYAVFGDVVMVEYEGENGLVIEKTDFPKGVSYDLKTNTLTLDNADLSALQAYWKYINEWYDEEKGELVTEEVCQLPSENLTIKLVGENTITSSDMIPVQFGDGVKVTVTGDGSLHIKAVNSVQQNDEGNYFGFNALELHNGASLTIGGNANVTVELQGEAMNDANEPAFLAAMRGNGHVLTVQDNAVLTTVLPEGARENGPKVEDGDDDPGNNNYPGGYRGLEDFLHITVKDKATLNTSELNIGEKWEWDEEKQEHVLIETGSFNLQGGTVNITPLGRYDWTERWEWDEENETHVFLGYADIFRYSGIHASSGTVAVSGGTLNITVKDETIEEGNMLDAYNGKILISGGTVNLDGPGEAFSIGGHEPENKGSVTVSGGKVNVLGENQRIQIRPYGSLTISGGELNVANGEIYVEDTWTDEDTCIGGSITVTGGKLIMGNGRINVNNGTFTLDGGTVNAKKSFTDDEWSSTMYIGWEGEAYIKSGTYNGETFNVFAGINNDGLYQQTGGKVILNCVGDPEKDGYNRTIGFNSMGTVKLSGGLLDLTGAMNGFFNESGTVEISGGSLNLTSTGILRYMTDENNELMLDENGDPITFIGGNGFVNSGGTTTISGGSHVFTTQKNEKIISTTALYQADGEVAITGGTVKLVADTAYYCMMMTDAPAIAIGKNVKCLSLIDAHEEVMIRVEGEIEQIVFDEFGNPVTDEETGEPVTELVPATFYWYEEDGQFSETDETSQYATEILFTTTDCGENASWTLDTEKGVLTVSGSGKMYDYADGAAPWYHLGKFFKEVKLADTITHVGSYAFSGNEKLEAITLGKTVTSVGENVFAGSSKVNVTLYHNTAADTHVKANNVKCTYIHEYKEATCSKPETCAYCDATQGKALGHAYSKPVFTWSEDFSTCTVTAVCSKKTEESCNFSQKATVTVKADKAACEGEGTATYTATITLEGKTYTDTKTGTVKAIGHSWGDWKVVKEATKTEDGLEERICANCGEKETRVIAKLSNKETFDPSTVENPFVDIAEEKFYYNAVLWAYSKDITTGKDDTHFNPSGPCTRAQVVTFLWRAAGKPAPKSAENPFPDVPNGKYYTDAVLWAVENNITAGFKDGTFGPNKTCTRGQIVTFLWRYAGEPEPETTENPFPDVDLSSYCGDAVLWAVEEGITGGFKDGTFGPNKTCTRDQIVTFLYRNMVEQ